MERHLNGWPAGCWYLPYLPAATAIGSEIDPMAILRPTRYDVGRRLVRELTRRAAPRIHNKNVSIAGSTGIESNLASVGRPAWSSRHGVEMRELEEVRSVAPAHPDLIGTASGR